AVEKARIPFDLKDGPLFRLVLIKEHDELHHLILTMHHIVTDKWSMQILRDQVAEYYSQLQAGIDPEVEALPIQYSDFAYWQSNQSSRQEELDFWKLQLTGAEAQALPYSSSLAETQKFEGGYVSRKLPLSLSRKLFQLSKDRGTTMFALLLTCFKVLIYKHTDQQDIIIGTPFSNRDQPELEQLIGFFNETLVLRNQLTNDKDFLVLLKEVQQKVLDCFSNKSVPFEQLVQLFKPDRIGAQNPFFRAMFLYHHVPAKPSFGSGITLDYAPFDLGVAKFDLTLYVEECNEELTVIFEYSKDYFEESTIHLLQEQLALVLAQITDRPSIEIGSISIVKDTERTLQLDKWNATETEQPTADSITHLIEEVISQKGGLTACTDSSSSITYDELNTRASQLARAIVAQTTGIHNPKIGLFVGRTTDLAVGILAILKAGGAYVPLDPDYPPARTQMILEDAEIPLILLPKELESDLPQTAAKLLFFESDHSQYDQPLPAIQPSNHAYVIYTSGSTGTPKGVPISHTNLIHSTNARFDFYNNQPEHFLLLSSFSFDSSVAGIFWTLTHGGQLVIPPKRIEQDIERLSQWIAKHKITHTLMLPSLYEVVLKLSAPQQLNTLNTVIVAGEACPRSLVDEHFSRLPQVHLYNEYGPTEASVWCIAHQITPSETTTSIPIGKPIPNTKAYILDANLQPRPIGVPGELYIGGPGVTSGYLNRPQLTHERFKPNPFGDGMLYKTGDLAVYDDSGKLFFLGRKDRQTKLRGYRIELDEIKHSLSQINDIESSEVLIDPKRQQILAFFIAANPLSEKFIQSSLQDVLPHYMVPNQVIGLNEFPRLPNGKVNTQQLLELAATAEKTIQKTAPSTTEEITLVKIWQELLQIESIGIHDNFFDLGGDSILSIQIISKLRAKGFEVQPNAIFQHQTIERLATAIQPSKTVKRPTTKPIGDAKLSPIQHWFFDTYKTGSNQWNLGLQAHVSNQIDAQAVQQIFTHILEKNEVFRMSFPADDTALYQENLSYIFEECNSSESTIEQLETEIEKRLASASSSFNVESGKMFYVLFVHQATGPNTIYLIAHHLIIDFVSWELLLAEADDLATHLLEHQTLPPLEYNNDYQAWLEHQHTESTLEKVQEELSYWEQQIDPSMEPSSFKEGDLTYITTTLNSDQTQVLLQAANAPYSTKIEELILTAYLTTLSEILNTEDLIVGLEHHGRDFNDQYSEAIGWHTTYYPNKFKISPLDLKTSILSTKNTCRNVPNHGKGFGILKRLARKPEIREQLKGAIPFIFNFLGKMRSAPKQHFSDFQFIRKNMRHPHANCPYIVQLNTGIVGLELQLNWTFSPGTRTYTSSEEFIALFDQNIRTLIEHCTYAEKTYSASDFSESGLSQNDLDTLLNDIEL
ncbi:MAG: amino acid adenylation domain-containing protein, partial [Saprospiraceae bacterium]|nr:amino acid adenylation domain-containing protein [Saprospiraceae bacterium]